MLNIYVDPDGRVGCDFIVEQYDEIMQGHKSGQLQGLRIFTKNFKKEDASLIAKIPNIKFLDFSDFDRKVDVQFCKGLTDLEYLHIGSSAKIDFDWFPSLLELRMDWSSDFINNEKSSLKVLALWKFKGKDLSSLTGLRWLERLDITDSTITALDGVSAFKKLKRMELYNMKNLEDISGLESDSLIELDITNAKKITDYLPLSKCPNLKYLKIHQSAPINSLNFVASLKKLESFRFLNTDVVGGDLSPLLELEDVYFTNKKHFLHKVKDFKN